MEEYNYRGHAVRITFTRIASQMARLSLWIDGNLINQKVGTEFEPKSFGKGDDPIAYAKQAAQRIIDKLP